jgi:hypothetical protein
MISYILLILGTLLIVAKTIWDIACYEKNKENKL